ncbi:amidase [Algicella marina]|uniref:Amidase n=1 Tax=Algicella marina TaxID=2683284 RepID=A0A6P1T3R4_9RHOB|nr:amidase family protein [Algicella marina]QHQ36385.1 amidase [Algicella marina]
MDLKASAAELGREIGKGRIDPVELTEAFLEAIANHPDSHRIYARTMPERARAEAAAAAHRARNGTRKGPLDGVPVSWKDLFDTAGVATESGSLLLKGRTPVRDAEVLRNAAGAGLVCLGKTHQTELAFSGLGINIRTATPPNAIAPELAPGGSSSGAAVSTALGLAAAGIGSDTGGSVRIPAVWNDLVGLKTASGDLSAIGTVPLAARFDTVGPLCHTVEDAALLYAVLANRPATDLAGASLAGLRVLALEGNSIKPVDDAPVAAFESALSRLSAAGVTIETASLPSVEEAMPLAGVLYTTEAYATWRTEIEANPDAMDPRVLARFRAGAQHSGADFIAAWLKLDALRADYHARTAGFDAVLLPTAPILPPNAQKLIAEDDYFVENNLLALRNTRVGSLMGSAALTLPTGTPHCGIMALVPPERTRLLLRIGAAMERALAA